MTSGGQWLQLSVTASSVLLAVGYYGFTPPHWTIYAANPPAWLANISGLTAWAGGLFAGIDAAVLSVSQAVGIPILGSFLFWMLIAIGARGSWVVSICSFAACIAMQFTVQRGYQSIARKWESTTHQVAEADAWLKVLYISERSGTFGALTNDPRALFEPLSRLTKLAGDQTVRGMMPPALPIDVRVGEVTITIESEHRPLPLPAFVTRGLPGYRAYVETLQEVADKTFRPDSPPMLDVDDLARSWVTDIQFLAAISAPADLLTTLAALKVNFPDEAREFVRHPKQLVVKIHDSENFSPAAARRLLTTEHQRSGLELTAFYDPSAGTMHLLFPEAGYRDYLLAIFKSLPDTSGRLGMSSEGARLLSDKLHTPMAHEIWHFIANNVPVFTGLPLPLEEGFASVLESQLERVVDASMRRADLFRQFPGWRNVERERQLVRAVSSCPPRMLQHWQVLKKAASTGAMLPLAPPRQIDTEPRYDNPDLVYAQGWALATRLWSDRPLFDRYRAALGRAHSAAAVPEDAALFASLTRELVQTAAGLCESHEPRS